MRLIALVLTLACWAGLSFATEISTAPADCDRAMTLSEDKVTAADVAGCYAVAQKLLDATQDGAAEPYFKFVCTARDLDTSPHACANLGKIYDARLGDAAAAEMAMTYYAQSCFHPRVATADGAGCLIYGTRLLAAWNNRATETPARNTITTASRALQRGCVDGVIDACAANEALSTAIQAGDFGFDEVSCLIKDKTGQVTSDQMCQSFSQYTNLVEGEMLQDGNYVETYFVWPDTDRTRIAYRGGFWSLNGRPTGDPRLFDGYLCLVNPLTERQFCAEMPD